MAEPKERDGITRIADERKRQLEVENYSDEHDDSECHEEGELAIVGALYALYPADVVEFSEGRNTKYFRELWPATWDKDGDKRTQHGEIRRLEIAGALLAAEIDRLLRKRAVSGVGE